MVTNLFISCAAEDLSKAKDLYGSISKAGFSCWLYENSTPVGKSHFSAEADGIQECSAFLLMVSKHSIRSREVGGELVLAHQLGKPLIPVLIDITWDQLVANRPDWIIILSGTTSLKWSNPNESSRPAFIEKLFAGLRYHGLVPHQPPTQKPAKVPEYKPTGRERRFGIFIHYDLKASETTDNIEESLERMEKRLRFLAKILRPSGPGDWQGWAFVFIDLGWTQIVRGGIDKSLGFRIANWVGKLKGRINNIDELVKLIGIIELDSFKTTLQTVVTKKVWDALECYLAGKEDTMRYDAPKVIEGLIRIANIGHHAPIFRFDDDVIFSGADFEGDTRRQVIGQFKTNIARLCMHFDLLTQEPDVGYFMFSGHYTAQNSDPVDRVINGHATRVLQLCRFSPSQHAADLANPFERVPQKPVELGPEIADDFLTRLIEYGAPSDRQVVSGAGLCLSDGAILDLPPFSNMRQNVVWIDDHLKYALHHELRHFGFIFGTKQRARVSDAAFSQNRYFRGNSSSHPVFTLRDVAWHLQVYMPRLVLGCVADAFLRADPCLKNQFKNKTQFNAAMQKVPSAYGKALANHHGGSLDIQVRLDLGKELWGIAQTRLKNLVDFFSGFNGTFLAAWTDGKLGAAATEYVPMAKPSFREAVEGIGNSPEFTAKRTEYTGDLRNCVTILTEDFLDYIEYTHAWREIVYTVRTQITRSRLPNQPPLPFQMT